MRVQIKVIPNAGREEVVEKNGLLTVRVREPPEGGKANKAVEKLLSKHYGKRARIVAGFKSRRKTIELIELTELT